ncbi:MASE4 domain-containing protein [uncultured Cellulomonas sp.]|uniref:sensor histidine kinase n=1 Tax=uncultured Cellulomonas sp. TaxID=189682 RepID=UPI00260578CB|nr:MASE4 domain-containing protein [uncultured Cellulomonas sp.]
MTAPAAPPALPVVRAGRAAVVVAAAVPVVTLALLAVSPVALGPIPAFLPAFLAVVWLCDVLTAVLLVTQYRAGGSPRLLALSWAYVWSAAVVVPHALVFPGLIAPNGLLGATPSSAPWLWTAWHVGMPVLIGAALAPWPRSVHRALAHATGRTRRAVVSAGVVVVGVAAVVALVTVGADRMPVVMVDGDYRPLTTRFGPWIAAVDLVALGVGLVGVLRRRRTGGLEAWALVAVTACCGDVLLTLLARERFTVGWYGARALALTAALVVLASMLRELTVLYGRVRDHAVRLDANNRDLREANALRDRLTAVVSHELRGPLAGIHGYLEIIDEMGSALPPGEVDRMLGRCGVLTRRLTLLTEDLLTVAAGDHGTLTVAPVPLDAHAQLREAAASIPELDVRVQPPRVDAPVLVADPLRVQQILANLLRNAQKYGRAPVLVSAGPVVDGLVELRVTDSGDGVPAHFVPHLFERFSRADTVGVSGTGLGLSIVRDLARAHGGDARYDVASASFLVTLPGAPTVPTQGHRGVHQVRAEAADAPTTAYVLAVVPGMPDGAGGSPG